MSGREDPIDDRPSPPEPPAMDDLRRLGESAFDAIVERVGRGVGRIQERMPLAHDLLEGDDAYLVVFDAPGATSQDVQVRFEDGSVTVRIDRFRGFHEGFEMRFPGRGLSLDGRADLPPDADVEADEATATLTDGGTLQVRIPKADDERTIDVTDEASRSADAGGPGGPEDAGRTEDAERTEDEGTGGGTVGSADAGNGA